MVYELVVFAGQALGTIQSTAKDASDSCAKSAAEFVAD